MWTTIRLLFLAALLAGCDARVDLSEYEDVSGEWTIDQIVIQERTYLGEALPDTTLRGDLGSLTLTYCDAREAQDGCPAELMLNIGEAERFPFTYVMSLAQDDQEVTFSWPAPEENVAAGWEGSYRYELAGNDRLRLRSLRNSSTFPGQYLGSSMEVSLKR
jgi:hypothetical protein